MALTNDIKILRVGSEGLMEPFTYPLQNAATVYAGSIALVQTTGGNAGTLKNSASPASTDVCVGIIGNPAGGTYVKTGPGITGGTSNTSVYVDALRGTFLLQSSTGSDQLSATTVGQTVYVYDESPSR